MNLRSLAHGVLARSRSARPNQFLLTIFDGRSYGTSELLLHDGCDHEGEAYMPGNGTQFIDLRRDRLQPEGDIVRGEESMQILSIRQYFSPQ